MDELLRGVFDKVLRGARAATDGLDAFLDGVEKIGNSALDRVEQLGSNALDALDRVDLDQFVRNLLDSDTEAGRRAYDEWVNRLRDEAERLKRERASGANRGGFGARFRAGNPFAILGVEKNAQWAEIRAAYARRVKVLHPDKRPRDIDERTRRRMDLELQQVYTAWEWFENNKQRFQS